MQAAWASETLVYYTTLHGVTTQKTSTWIFSAAKTSNPTLWISLESGSNTAGPSWLLFPSQIRVFFQGFHIICKLKYLSQKFYIVLYLCCHLVSSRIHIGIIKGDKVDIWECDGRYWYDLHDGFCVNVYNEAIRVKTHIQTHNTLQSNEAVTVWTCILKVPASNVDRVTSYCEWRDSGFSSLSFRPGSTTK
jgi:hypothetical protein